MDALGGCDELGRALVVEGTRSVLRVDAASAEARKAMSLAAPSSSMRRISSTNTPVALITTLARSSRLSPVRESRARTPQTSPSSSLMIPVTPMWLTGSPPRSFMVRARVMARRESSNWPS